MLQGSLRGLLCRRSYYGLSPSLFIQHTKMAYPLMWPFRKRFLKTYLWWFTSTGNINHFLLPAEILLYLQRTESSAFSLWWQWGAVIARTFHPLVEPPWTAPTPNSASSFALLRPKQTPGKCPRIAVGQTKGQKARWKWSSKMERDIVDWPCLREVLRMVQQL